MSKTVVRRFGDREVRLTSLDKVMFPEAGLTKGDLIDYVVRCAEPLLAALRNRPLTMERRVNGLRDDGFIQKHKPEHFPDWVHTVEVATSKGPIQQVVVDDLPTLVLVTNFGCLTLHVPPGLGGDLEHPDSLVLDLDPSTDDTPRMRQAGHRVRGLLDELGLPAYARWSGSSGLHVLVPLDRSAQQSVVVALAQQLGRTLASRHPDLFTVAFHKADRGDLIFVDIARNHPGGTVAASWTVRARPTAPVAMPIRWEELDETSPRAFTLRDAPERLGLDLWPGFEEARVDARRYVQR
jgi:bifunctional non-homologous end joining protein LigD